MYFFLDTHRAPSICSPPRLQVPEDPERRAEVRSQPGNTRRGFTREDLPAEASPTSVAAPVFLQRPTSSASKSLLSKPADFRAASRREIIPLGSFNKCLGSWLSAGPRGTGWTKQKPSPQWVHFYRETGFDAGKELNWRECSQTQVEQRVSGQNEYTVL